MKFLIKLIFLILLSTSVFAVENTEAISVIEYDFAQEIFAEISQRSNIPFDFPDGCHAKAQKIAMLLEAKGIIVGKSFVEGQIFYKSHWGESFWLFHVAPYIFVQSSGKIHKMIIDPFLADHLLNYDEWISIISKDHRTKIIDNYDTNRFIYDPSVKTNTYNDYVPEFIYDMEVIFRQIRKKLSNYHHFRPLTRL